LAEVMTLVGITTPICMLVGITTPICARVKLAPAGIAATVNKQAAIAATNITFVFIFMYFSPYCLGFLFFD
jgi:hypothetical protein